MTIHRKRSSARVLFKGIPHSGVDKGECRKRMDEGRRVGGKERDGQNVQREIGRHREKLEGEEVGATLFEEKNLGPGLYFGSV